MVLPVKLILYNARVIVKKMFLITNCDNKSHFSAFQLKVHNKLMIYTVKASDFFLLIKLINKKKKKTLKFIKHQITYTTKKKVYKDQNLNMVMG